MKLPSASKPPIPQTPPQEIPKPILDKPPKPIRATDAMVYRSLKVDIGSPIVAESSKTISFRPTEHQLAFMNEHVDNVSLVSRVSLDNLLCDMFGREYYESYEITQ